MDYIQASGVARYIEASIVEKEVVSDFEHAVELDVPMDKQITVESGSQLNLFNPNKEKIDIYTKNYNYKETGSYIRTATACKATPIIVALGSTSSTHNASVTIKRTDFKEIKTLKFPSKTITVSRHKKIPQNAIF